MIPKFNRRLSGTQPGEEGGCPGRRCSSATGPVGGWGEGAGRTVLRQCGWHRGWGWGPSQPGSPAPRPPTEPFIASLCSSLTPQSKHQWGSDTLHGVEGARVHPQRVCQEALAHHRGEPGKVWLHSVPEFMPWRFTGHKCQALFPRVDWGEGVGREAEGFPRPCGCPFSPCSLLLAHPTLEVCVDPPPKRANDPHVGHSLALPRVETKQRDIPRTDSRPGGFLCRQRKLTWGRNPQTDGRGHGGRHSLLLHSLQLTELSAMQLRV